MSQARLIVKIMLIDTGVTGKGACKDNIEGCRCDR